MGNSQELELKRVATVFTEWARRWEEEPESFEEYYGPSEEYGEGAARYFAG